MLAFAHTRCCTRSASRLRRRRVSLVFARAARRDRAAGVARAMSRNLRIVASTLTNACGVGWARRARARCATGAAACAATISSRPPTSRPGSAASTALEACRDAARALAHSIAATTGSRCCASSRTDFAAPSRASVRRHGARAHRRVRRHQHVGHPRDRARLSRRPRDGDASRSCRADFYRYRHSMFAVTEFVRRVLGLRGPAMTVSTACSSSAKVFAQRARAIAAGVCDAAVVGGVDSLALSTLYGFNSLGLLSREPCRPFDAERDGISIGEAAGFALLDPAADGAVALVGYGESSDALPHVDAASGGRRRRGGDARGARVRAVSRRATIDYVNLHGTASRANDAPRISRCAACFGQRGAARLDQGLDRPHAGRRRHHGGAARRHGARRTAGCPARSIAAASTRASGARIAHDVAPTRAAPCDEQLVRLRRQQLHAGVRASRHDRHAVHRGASACARRACPDWARRARSVLRGATRVASGAAAEARRAAAARDRAPARQRRRRGSRSRPRRRRSRAWRRAIADRAASPSVFASADGDGAGPREHAAGAGARCRRRCRRRVPQLGVQRAGRLLDDREPRRARARRRCRRARVVRGGRCSKAAIEVAVDEARRCCSSRPTCRFPQSLAPFRRRPARRSRARCCSRRARRHRERASARIASRCATASRARRRRRRPPRSPARSPAMPRAAALAAARVHRARRGRRASTCPISTAMCLEIGVRAMITADADRGADSARGRDVPARRGRALRRATRIVCMRTQHCVAGQSAARATAGSRRCMRSSSPRRRWPLHGALCLRVAAAPRAACS